MKETKTIPNALLGKDENGQFVPTKTMVRIVAGGQAVLSDIETQRSGQFINNIRLNNPRVAARCTKIELDVEGKGTRPAYVIDIEGAKELAEVFNVMTPRSGVAEATKVLAGWILTDLVPAMEEVARTTSVVHNGTLHIKLPDGSEHLFQLPTNAELRFAVSGGGTKTLKPNGLYRELNLV